MDAATLIARFTREQIGELKKLIRHKEKGHLCACGAIIPKARRELGLDTCKACAQPTRILLAREGIGGGNTRVHTQVVFRH